MAFKKHNNSHHELELPSLIDVVFLLLIFFLVVVAFAMSRMEVAGGTTQSDLDLPRAATDIPVEGQDVLENLLIQIEQHVTDGPNPTIRNVVYILRPSFNAAQPVTRQQAYETALLAGDSISYTQEPPVDDFAQTAVSLLITQSIADYVTEAYANGRRPIIEIRAEREVEFRIIRHIMDCAAAHEDRIPQVMFRTTS